MSSPSPGSAPRRLVHIVTVATNVRAELHFLLTSARLHGLTPIVLGMGDPNMRPGYVDFSTKFKHTRAWLRGALNDGIVVPSDLVVFVDAYDVLITGDADTFWQTFTAVCKQAGTSDADVVVSAESNCYPDAHFAPTFDRLAEQAAARDGRAAPSKYRYVNSGLYAGRAAAVLAMLELSPDLNRVGEMDDQRMLTKAFLAQARMQPIRARGFRFVLDRDHVMLPSVHADTRQEILAKASRTPVIHTNGSKQDLPVLFHTLFPASPAAASVSPLTIPTPTGARPGAPAPSSPFDASPTRSHTSAPPVNADIPTATAPAPPVWAWVVLALAVAALVTMAVLAVFYAQLRSQSKTPRIAV